LSWVLLSSCTARRHRLARSCCFSDFRWLARSCWLTLSCSFSDFRRLTRFRWLTFTFSRRLAYLRLLGGLCRLTRFWWLTFTFTFSRRLAYLRLLRGLCCLTDTCRFACSCGLTDFCRLTNARRFACSRRLARSPRFSTRWLRNLPGLRTLFLFLLFSFFFLLRTGDARERKTTN